MSPEEYAEAQKDADKDIFDYLKENGLELLVELAFEDIKKCADDLDIPTCIWAVVQNLGPGKALKLADKFPKIAKVIWGINKFLDKVAEAKGKLKKGREVLSKFRKTPCEKLQSNSFTPETPVLMADGTRKPIKDVEIGQQVLASSPESGRTEGRTVTNVIVGEALKHLVEITVDTDGESGRATGAVTATGTHPFWVESQRRWIDAKDLKVGDRLRAANGELREVIGTRSWTETRTVYNLTVEDIHTYYVFAGTSPILVHNSNVLCGVKALEEGDWQHILDRHRAGGKLVDDEAGLFIGKEKNVRKRIADAINRGTRKPNTPDPETGEKRPGFIYEWDFGSPIGKAGPKNGGGDLTRIRVVVNEGKVVTAFPF